MNSFVSFFFFDQTVLAYDIGFYKLSCLVLRAKNLNMLLFVSVWMGWLNLLFSSVSEVHLQLLPGGPQICFVFRRKKKAFFFQRNVVCSRIVGFFLLSFVRCLFDFQLSYFSACFLQRVFSQEKVFLMDQLFCYFSKKFFTVLSLFLFIYLSCNVFVVFIKM